MKSDFTHLLQVDKGACVKKSIYPLGMPAY